MSLNFCRILPAGLVAVFSLVGGPRARGQSVYPTPYVVTTLAGEIYPTSSIPVNGTGTAAIFNQAEGVAVDSQGNVFVADYLDNAIRQVTPAGVVTTYAGVLGQAGSGYANGTGSGALFDNPDGIAVDAQGNVYVSDTGNEVIRKISPGGVVTTLAGDPGVQGSANGTGSAAQFNAPVGIAVDSSGTVYVADSGNDLIREITPAGVVTTLAGSLPPALPATIQFADGTRSAAAFDNPVGIAVAPGGDLLYVTDWFNTVRSVAVSTGVVTTLAGQRSTTAGSADGTGSKAQFNKPQGIAVDDAGTVYIDDTANFTIRRMQAGGVVTTLAGSPPGGGSGGAGTEDGTGSVASFEAPKGLAVDGYGTLYVGDLWTIREALPPSLPPVILTQPSSLSVSLGSSAAFTVAAEGSPLPSYQWALNGTALAGATSTTYAVAAAGPTDAGTYTVTVSNLQTSGTGSVTDSVTSAGAVLTVFTAPVVTPVAANPAPVAFGGTTDLAVTVEGSGPITYQWSLNGSALAGATSSTYAASYPGAYVVTVTDANGSATSAMTVAASSRLSNISTRADILTGSDIAIPGFVVSGPAGSTKQLLVRAVGPTLATFAVTGTIASPELVVYDGSGAPIVSDAGWGNAPVVGTSTSGASFRRATAADFAQVGAFGLGSGSADSAVVVTVPTGPFTVEVFGAGSGTGVGLAEIYEMNASDSALLINISTRTFIGSLGDQLAIPGFVIGGTQTASVLIRGIGPTLGSLGVPSTIALPVLEVFDGTGAGIATNQGWGTAPVPGSSALITGAAPSASVRAATTADFVATGAFGLNADSADSAMVVSLPPGHYTAQVSGAQGSTGATLVEAYLIPSP